MIRDFDVVIIGAGIGGLSIAHLLAKEKLRVAMIDAKANLPHVSFYTLGSFMDLDRYGLTRNVVAADITEGFFHSSHFHLKRGGGNYHCYIINKKNLYQELLDKARQNGVVVFEGTEIETHKQVEDGMITSVSDRKGDEYSAKVFIDSSGVSGFFSRKFGLQDKEFNIATGLEYNVEYTGPQNQAHLYTGKLYQGGYGWLFPFGGKRAILGYGSFNNTARQELKKRLNAMLEVPFIKNVVKKDNEELSGGTIPVTDVKTKFVYSNVVCIGDSVSQVNPIVGEGHRFILESGKIAAPYITQAILKNDLEILHGYEKEWYGKFYTDYKWSRILQQKANSASRSDFLMDLSTVYLALKRNKTFVDMIAGHISFWSFLFP